MRFHRIRLTLLYTLGLAACTSTPPEEREATGRTSGAITPASTSRPLVLLVSPPPGPTAPAAEQWWEDSVAAGIPFGGGGTVSYPLRTDAVACGSMFGIQVAVDITHPRPTDLVITLSTSYYQRGALRFDRTLIWDGPAVAAGKSEAEIARITLPAVLDAADHLQARECANWRVYVGDTGTRGGTLNGYRLRRRHAWAPIHDATFYRDLLFGGGIWSVARFFWEESRQRFTITEAGTYTTPWTSWYKASDAQHVADTFSMLYNQGFDFERYDTNHDDRITDDELLVVDVDNVYGNAGANRGGACSTFAKRGGSGSFQVCTRVALLSSTTDFQTAAHEISHSLGTYDIYADGCRSNGLSLMSCTIGQPDERSTIYHDPWHRAALGWLTPYDGNFGSAGRTTLGDETYRDPSGSRTNPIRLRNPADLTEYFLFEQRSQTGYDRSKPDPAPGVAIWHVKENGNGGLFEIPGQRSFGVYTYAVGPDTEQGGHLLWHELHGRFRIHWLSGAPVENVFWIDDRNTSSYLDWDIAPPVETPPAVRITSPADGAHASYGLGVPLALNAEGTDATGQPVTTFAWTATGPDGRSFTLGGGAVLAYGFPAPGRYTITVTGRDRFGAPASSSINVTLENPGPTPRIDAPAQGAVLYRGQPIVLTGSGSTPSYFALPCNRVIWTMDLVPGYAHNGSATDLAPCTMIDTFQVTGPAVFTLTVIDEFDVISQATVQVTFVEPPAGGPPIVTILAPQPNSRLMLDRSYSVSGLVSDPAGGAVDYRWTVFDPATGVETELARTALFSWAPHDQFIFSTNVALRLYGTSSQGQTTIASQDLQLIAPTR